MRGALGERRWRGCCNGLWRTHVGLRLSRVGLNRRIHARPSHRNHAGLSYRFGFGQRPPASDVSDVTDVTDVPCVAASRVDDRGVHFEPLAVGLLKAALAALAKGERQLITRAAGVVRGRVGRGVRSAGGVRATSGV